MERLEAKKIKGNTYYYYSKWARVDGKCRRVWQRYLGKLQDIVQAVDGPQPASAEVFQWGLPESLWQQARRCDVVQCVDRRSGKRKQGLTTGEYLAIAALNRAICPQSKRSMWEWFCETSLMRHFQGASAQALSSQRFWDHMSRLDGDDAAAIWKELLHGVIARESIDLSSISYDGTNFYTFIDTFNVRCQIARRGKNKQGRANLRQVNYALFCCADGHLPLFYDVYEGNRNDAKQFPLMLKRFHAFFRDLSPPGQAPPETTLIFDKGNNSQDNFRLLDALQFKFVGSVRLDQHRDLAEIPNDDSRFQDCPEDLEGTKAFRVKRTVAGRERTLVVTYNQNLFDSQWRTVQHDIGRAIEQLAELQQRLRDRINGVITKGKAPTVGSVQKQCQGFLSRQHMKQVIRFDVKSGDDDTPRLTYSLDGPALQTLCETYLGKNLIITNRDAWTDDRIIRAYRSQFIIESVFKESKDRRDGTWWPMYHWTDSKIKVHALYSTIALLLRALMLRRVQQKGMRISMARLLTELAKIREVVTIFPDRRRKEDSRRTVLTQRSPLQEQLLSVLEIESKTAS